MSRFPRYCRGAALAEFKRQRVIWSKPVAYWIAVWRYGKTYTPILAAYMLAALGVTREEIERYEQEPPR